MRAPRVFDQQHYELLNNSRGEVVRRLLSEVKDRLGLRTAIDVGCGLGHFSGLLQSLGFQVTAVDGREQNVEEARRRYPNVKFLRHDAEDPALRLLGRFDLVFCFGLLYHLENPLLAIRHLHALTEKVFLAESVIFPGDDPIMGLMDESPYEDQGLNHIAFYPTEACLIKMFYRSGFQEVHAFKEQPKHPEYHKTPTSMRIRTILAASHAPLESDQVFRVSEPSSKIHPWDPRSGMAPDNTVQKIKRFADKPLSEKVKSIKKIIQS